MRSEVVENYLKLKVRDGDAGSERVVSAELARKFKVSALPPSDKKE